MISISLPKVLFIKGVFKRDCATDDLLEKKVLDSIHNEAYINTNVHSVMNDTNEYSYGISEKVTYQKLPSVFESLSTWPTKTNLLCWHCSLSFDTVPIFIPKVIEPIISKTKVHQYSMGVYGVFCTFGDAMEFIKNRNWSIVDKIDAMNKLKHLHKVFYNTQYKDIVSYPSIYDMVQYGGDLDIQKYKQLINRYKLTNDENSNYELSN